MEDYTAKDENLLPLFPGLLPYGHTIGAPAFRPTEMGAIISKSSNAMNEQVEAQMNQIRQQVELLQKQYQELEERRIISNWIYSAELRFSPDIGHTYYLYRRENDTVFLTMISPNEWKKAGLQYIATVKLLSDMTWQVLEKSAEF